MNNRGIYLFVGVGGLIVGLVGYDTLPFEIWAGAAVLGFISLLQGLTSTDVYQDHSRTLGPDWKPTAERYFDPASGQMMEVRIHATTGERRSVPAQTTRIARPAY